MASIRFGIGPKALSRGLACACLLMATSMAGSAHAQGDGPDSDRANQLFKKGKVAFNAGKYNDALRIYSEAWSLKQSPDIAANLAQTESELGRHRDAAEHFSFALDHLLPSSTDEQKQALAEGLAEEKKEIGSLRVTLEPSDSEFTIDGARVTVPPSGDVFIEPGEHAVAVNREGYEPNQQTIRVSRGASQVLWIKLNPANGSPDAAAEQPIPNQANEITSPPSGSHSHRSIVPAIIGGGLVAAGAAVGVVFLVSANSSQKDADRLQAGLPDEPNVCGAGTPHAAECGALHDKNSDIDRAHTIEIVGFSVAGAAAVGTAVYLLWPHAHSSSSASLSPSLSISPSATNFALSGRF